MSTSSKKKGFKRAAKKEQAISPRTFSKTMQAVQMKGQAYHVIENYQNAKKEALKTVSKKSDVIVNKKMRISHKRVKSAGSSNVFGVPKAGRSTADAILGRLSIKSK